MDATGEAVEASSEVLAAPSPEGRARIVAAARRGFFAHGFSRMTMDDLARELGMSKKTLYVHFPTKGALVAKVLAEKIAEVRAGAEVILAESGIGFPKRSSQFLAHIVRQLGEISPVFLRDLERLLPNQFAHISTVRREMLPRVWGQLLAEGSAAGHVRSDVDPALIAEMLRACAEALLSPAMLERHHLAPRDVIERILSVFLAGILTSAGRQAYEDQKPS